MKAPREACDDANAAKEDESIAGSRPSLEITSDVFRIQTSRVFIHE